MISDDIKQKNWNIKNSQTKKYILLVLSQSINK